MRVVEIRKPGGPDVLRVSERDSRPLAGDGVRVRVRSSGVNRADLMQRRGRYPPPPGYPADGPGLEFAGTAEELGPSCRLRAVGDRVMGLVGGAGYADEVVVPERETIRVPTGLSLEEAGAIPEAFVTAWDAFGQAELRPGETVLIHAVGSGVGTAALQLARAMGARSVGTSRTRAKVRRALGLGLEHGIACEGQEAWVAEARRILGEAGADVVLDLVGGDYVEGNLEILATRGRWIVVGLPAGREGTLDLRKLMSKRGTIRGTVLRARPDEEKALLAREFERSVVPLFERGRIAPVVGRIFDATEAGEAHRYVEANESFGKVLLSWDV